MKIVLIGGGSYVFAPSVIEDLIIKSKLSDFDLVLVDVNLEGAEILANIASRIATDEGLEIRSSATANRLEALENADYVITSVAIEGAKRWNTDYEICKQEGIPYELRECGALSGISYSFRNITLLMGICRDMEKICPKAVLLNVSNPLTKIQTAIHRYTQIESYGFCNVAMCGANGYERVAYILGVHYSQIDVVSAGINHFTWITQVKDKSTGKNLFPIFLEKLFALDDKESRVMQRWYNEYGAVTAPPVGHTCDFLPYQPDIDYLDRPPYHGTPEERAMRTEELRRAANGELDYHSVDFFRNGSWEHPGLVAVALRKKGDMYLPALNLPNNNYLPQLPEGAIVEVPVEIKQGKMQPATNIHLPEKIVEVCINQCEVTEMIAKAAVEGNRDLAFKVIETDRAITKKEAAARALAQMLTAHGDILPQFK